jgi:hypothetical protein
LNVERGGDNNCGCHGNNYGCHGNQTASWRVEAGGNRVDFIIHWKVEILISPGKGIEFPGGSSSMTALFAFTDYEHLSSIQSKNAAYHISVYIFRKNDHNPIRTEVNFCNKTWLVFAITVFVSIYSDRIKFGNPISLILGLKNLYSGDRREHYICQF